MRGNVSCPEPSEACMEPKPSRVLTFAAAAALHTPEFGFSGRAAYKQWCPSLCRRKGSGELPAGPRLEYLCCFSKKRRPRGKEVLGSVDGVPAWTYLKGGKGKVSFFLLKGTTQHPHPPHEAKYRVKELILGIASPGQELTQRSKGCIQLTTRCGCNSV